MLSEDQDDDQVPDRQDYPASAADSTSVVDLDDDIVFDKMTTDGKVFHGVRQIHPMA